MSSRSKFWNEKVLPCVPGIIRHDFWRKLFALFFALLLWGAVKQQIRSSADIGERTLNRVPVHFVAKDGDFKVVPRDEFVSVTVRVPKDVKDLKDTDLTLECPVTISQIENNEPMKLELGMVKRNRQIDNLTVQKILPEAILLNLDYVDEMDVKVLPVCDAAELMDGYRVYRAPVADPEKVRIRGPKRALATIPYLETEKIPLSNVTKSFSRLAQLRLPNNEKNGNVEILSDSVRVEVEIKKNDPRPIAGIPIQVLFGRTGANTLTIAKIQPESITVLVEIDAIPDVSMIRVHPFLDLSEVTKPGVYNVDIKCWSDNDNVKVVELIPAQATVTLEPAVPASSN